MKKQREKSSEEKLLSLLHSQLSSAYATGLFGVKDYEKKIASLSIGETIGVNGVILGKRQEKLLGVCQTIDKAMIAIETLLVLYEQTQ